MADPDLVVIGAGIQGAGVAQAAAAAGYRPLLLEQAEGPASATSSRSSKLIHGGLRYLESGQLGLVRECLRERALLLRNAPELVRLIPFHLPVYRGAARGRGRIALGLRLYALLAGLGAEARFRRLPRAEWGRLDGLEVDGLETVFSYHDGQTDDALLTAAVVASARGLGAQVRYRARVDRLRLERDGCVVEWDGPDGGGRIAVPAVVNAAGPWAARLAARCTPPPPPPSVELVQGSHLLLPGPLAHGAYYLEAHDRRGVFVLPWHGRRLIGTTERPFRGDPAAVAPTEAEINYLLATHNRHFPRAAVAAEAIVTCFAGLRVLPGGDAQPFHRPRDTLIATDRARAPRFLTLVGGKLTAYRATAERVIARLGAGRPRPRRRADTRTLPLRPPPGTAGFRNHETTASAGHPHTEDPLCNRH